jgi:integrase
VAGVRTAILGRPRPLSATRRADRRPDLPTPSIVKSRHTCVSLLLAEGAPPHVVQQIVGHSAIDVTMTIYAHASLDEKRTALSRLGERLA